MNQAKKKAKILAGKFLRLLKKKNCYLEIYLLNSQKMKFLNKKFLNKNKTSNILTFVEPENFPHPESPLKFLGEIYLKSPITNYKLLITLLAHGLLHLMGFQHKKKSDRIKMEAKEKFLIFHV